VQRVLKFVKYLRDFDIRPVVLTVENGDFPVRDESLIDEIPEDVKVYRTTIFEPYTIYRRLTGKAEGTAVDVNNIPKPGQKRSFTESVAELIRSNLFIPDARIGWLPYAVREAEKIIKLETIDCLYSSSPPYTSALIARKLMAKTGLPWIAGFRDPWTGFLSTPVRYGLAKSWDRHLEKSVYAECSRMEVAWKGIAKDFAKKYPDIDTKKVVHIENGFDAAEIPKTVYERNEKFTVTYTGSMYGKRSPKPFLDAIKSLIAKGEVDAAKLKLNFIGRFGADILPLFEDPVFHHAIEVKSYLAHSESIEELIKSDALLLVVDDTDGSAEIVPGKVYEYMGTSRPIITLALEGAIAELIRETHAGTVASFREQVEIESAFLKYYRAFWNQEVLWEGSALVIKKYTRREGARKLADMVKEVLKEK
jgi:hypothetical protein